MGRTLRVSDLVTQFNEELYEVIQKEGCFFLCLLAIGQLEAGKALNAKQVNEAYDELTKSPDIMTKSCRMNQHLREAINYVFDLFSVDKRAFQIGVYFKETGERRFWRSSLDNVDYTILKGKTNLGNSHFRLGFGATKVVDYDPRPGTIIVREIRSTYYEVVDGR